MGWLKYILSNKCTAVLSVIAMCMYQNMQTVKYASPYIYWTPFIQ